MTEFEKIARQHGQKLANNPDKFPRVGSTIEVNTDIAEGHYWFYETDNFIIDIHDFFLKQDRIQENFDIRSLVSFYSSYIFVGSGEYLEPYQTLSSNSINVVNLTKVLFKAIMHKNSPYFSVGINFRPSMIEEYIAPLKLSYDLDLNDMFFSTKETITKPIRQLALDISHCKMELPAAQLFLEAKAKEWLCITLDAYLQRPTKKELCPDDKQALSYVTRYIDDHYSLSISQELLAKIAMMSVSKLKNLFKATYDMSITEYIQRKRMDIAEHLLLTTDLEIQHIAKSVGYTSHSKFTSYFKRYKGMYPSEMKKIYYKNNFTS